jgi:exodeoxyribonuclease III
MRIVSLNVNGIRAACAKGLWPWLMRQKADVICLQEVRCELDLIPKECAAAKGYHAHFHPATTPGYSGVALYSREKPDRVQKGIGWPDVDAEGRYLQADFGDLSVVSLYLPSGSSSEARQAVKFDFLRRFETHLAGTKGARREMAICGDFNIAHKEIDLRNWRSNQKNSGFLPEERAWLDRLFGTGGFVDAFRQVNQNPDQYTWWSNRGRAYENNVGWRLDYHVVTPTLGKAARRVSIYTEKKFSDHAPVTIDYDYPHSRR